MPRPEIATAGAVAREAEVRRLVPAVAGRRQRVDHLLEVALHRVRLPRELLAVRMREARARLRLELVAREVLGLERERLVQVALEVRGALAGDAVEEVERDVVKPGIPEMVERSAGRPLDRRAARARSSSRGWKLCAPSETRVTPLSRRSAASCGRHRLRVRLDRHLLGAGQRAEQPLELAGIGERRRAAAEEDRLELRREHGPLELELREQRVDVRRVLIAASRRR